jgi:2-keto-4-pentenoate hydratase
MSQTLPETVHRAVVDALFEGAAAGAVDLGRLPVTSLTPEQGLLAQLGVLSRWQEQGERLGGWKVGLTSGAGRDSMGPGYRPFGYILRNRILPSGSLLHADDCPIQQLEVELCLEIGDRLQGRGQTTSTVAAAVRGVRPAFELNQLRIPPLTDPGITIADDLAHWGIVIGALGSWTFARKPHAILQCDGHTVAQVSAEELDMDPPLLAVQRLCDRLADIGLGLEPGQLVITGALIKVPISTNGKWHTEIRGLGSADFALQ